MYNSVLRIGNKLFITILFVSFFTIFSTLSATTVTLHAPADDSRCVPQGDIEFRWSIDNPDGSNITKQIFFLAESTTDFSYVDTLFLFENSLLLNSEDLALDTNLVYDWSVLVIQDDPPYFIYAPTSIFQLSRTPVFGDNSFADFSVCVPQTATFDWTHDTNSFEYHLYDIQVSKTANFISLVTAQPITNTSALATLQLNTTYFWRLQSQDCSQSFSEVRTFRTIPYIATLISPQNNGYCADVINLNASEVKLIWQDSLNENVRYQVQIQYDTVAIDTIVADQYFKLNIDDLYNKKIMWRVRVVDETFPTVCNSDWTPYYSFYTPYEKVEPLSPLTGSTCVSMHTPFVWRQYASNTADTIAYEIFISSIEDFSDTVLITTYGALLTNIAKYDTMIVNLPNPNTAYYWKIRISNVGNYINYSVWSEVSKFITNSPAPTLISPTDGKMGLVGDIQLNWSKAGSNNTYSIQIANDTSFQTASIIKTIKLSDTFLIFEPKIELMTYYWRVSTFDMNDDCESDYSNYYSFSTKLGVPKIIYPGNVYTDTDTIATDTLLSNDVTFKWKTPEEITIFDIQYSKNINSFTDGSNNLVYIPYIVGDSISIDLLDTNTTYYWRLRSRKDNDTSDWTEIHYFVTGYYVPLPTKLILPKNSTTFVSLKDPFVWEQSQFATSYEISFATVSQFNDTNYVLTVYSNDTTFLFPEDSIPLQNGVKYYWKVRGINMNNFSRWSATWTFTSIPDVPKDTLLLVQPINNATDIVPDNAYFKWTYSNDAQYYRLQIAKDTEFSDLFIDTNVNNSNQLFINNLATYTDYYWRVLPGNGNGDGINWSEIFKFSTSTTNILDNFATYFINIVPNPVSNSAVCNLGLLVDSDVQMVVIDSKGNEIQKTEMKCYVGNNSININTNILSNGAYLCNIISNNKIIASVQFIVTK